MAKPHSQSHEGNSVGLRSLSVLTSHVPSATLWHNLASAIQLRLETKATWQETYPLTVNHAVEAPQQELQGLS